MAVASACSPMSSSATAVSLARISKAYDIAQRGARATTLAEGLTTWIRRRARSSVRVWALKEISLEVGRGELVGIVGRNGAGKSTLLKILSRITEPTSGEARVFGQVGSLLEVGTGFHPELTGRENVYLNGAILGMRRAEIRRRFDEIVGFSGIAPFIDTPVKRYSSGMFMRLAFAVAAHLDTDILLVDEVLAVGDAEFQKRCLGRMREVSTGGRTVLFVSHNLAAISALCSRAILLTAGQVSFDGDTEACLEHYARESGVAGGSAWSRIHPTASPLSVEQVTLSLTGRQPECSLILEVLAHTRAPHAPAFLAVDIEDAAGVPIMQALPRPEPFIHASSPWHRSLVTIHLPPLVPGLYQVSVWLGSHHTSTLDWPRRIVSFEILESPTPGRSFPHGLDRGHVVPRAALEYEAKPHE